VCLCVCAGFVMCGCVSVVGFVIMYECMCGFCKVWMCVCVGFVICERVYVALYCVIFGFVGFVMCFVCVCVVPFVMCAFA